jgi:hypothetical protein
MATNNFTTNSSGALTTINGQPITESVTVNSIIPTIPVTTGDTSPAILPSVPLVGLPLSGTPITAQAGNPNSRGVNDVSDIRPTSTVVYLPTRAEKRLIPQKVNAAELQGTFDDYNELSGNSLTVQRNKVQDTDFYITPSTAAKRLLTDYIKVRIPHRGVNSSSLQPDPTQAVEFRFLINPHTVTVNRQTVDTQSLTRGGWQFGVWGEDCFMVQLQGTSAGSYFTRGLTDEYSYYAVSYRNLMQLQEVFENNGYWFEGEEYNEGPLAADYLRRRIRMHQDVELWYGNFIWFGMFDGLTVSQDATQPFMLNFTLSFFVWREKYRSTSPYWGSIENNVERGHAYPVVVGQNSSIQTNNTLSQYAPSALAFRASQATAAAAAVGSGAAGQAPAVVGANANDLEPVVPMNPPSFFSGVSNPVSA